MQRPVEPVPRWSTERTGRGSRPGNCSSCTGGSESGQWGAWQSSPIKKNKQRKLRKKCPTYKNWITMKEIINLCWFFTTENIDSKSISVQNDNLPCLRKKKSKGSLGVRYHECTCPISDLLEWQCVDISRHLFSVNWVCYFEVGTFLLVQLSVTGVPWSAWCVHNFQRGFEVLITIRGLWCPFIKILLVVQDTVEPQGVYLVEQTMMMMMAWSAWWR